MQSEEDQLRQVVTSLIAGKGSIESEVEASRALGEFFAQITSVGSDSENERERAMAEVVGGLAIGPWQAAQCVREVRRTGRFISGIAEAIGDLIDRFPDERLEVVYAGCGPYGTILIPALTLFDRSRIAVTFIDVHQDSLDSVRSIVAHLGFDDLKTSYCRSDASTYTHPTAPHLVISETMQNALQTEPQVSISLNFGRQLHSDGIFVPQEISIRAMFARPGAESVSPEVVNERVDLGEIVRFDPTKSDARQTVIAPAKLTVPTKPSPEHCFVLSTSIRIYADHLLLPRDSSITNFLVINELSNIDRPYDVEFRYEIDQRPGFRWRVIDTEE